MKIDAIIEDAARRFEQANLFYGHGTDNPYDEAVYLVYSLLGIDFSESPEQVVRPVSEQERLRLEQAVDARITKRVPTAYLVGEAWFAGHSFFSDERALIPRSPLAELILNDFQPLLEATPAAILDVCCGGGCIGIACALQFPDSQVDLLDISSDCLELAEKNIARHGLQDSVQTLQSDLFDELGSKGKGRYGLIIANPPYVSRDEYAELPAEYGHEPQLGLTCPEEGLEIPLQILRQAEQYLQPGGMLIMEVGYSADALVERLPTVPFLWLQFEQGGEGVLALSCNQLRQFREALI